MIKTKESTAGFKSGCPDFNPCPLCYGCRNYDPSYYKCVNVCGGSKYDVCDKKKHTEKAIGMMMQRQEIAL